MSQSELIAKAQELRKRLDIQDRKRGTKVVKNCFIGTDAVKCIIDLKYAFNEQQAIDFGNLLIQNNLVQHHQRHHTFKNEDLLYIFLDDTDSNTPSPRQQSLASQASLSEPNFNGSSKRLSSRSSGRFTLNARKGRHRSAGSNLTFTNWQDLYKNGVRRKDVYFRVNKYMRQNRVSEAANFLREVLKHVTSGNASIDWSVLQGPSENNIDLNHITDAEKEKYLQDIMGESQACWIDVSLLESKLKLFYEASESAESEREQSNANESGSNKNKYLQCIAKYESILDALARSLESMPSLLLQSYYYRFIECETRASLAYAMVESERNGYTKYAGLALEHCRKAMKLDAFHSFSHAMYGYLLDRCLDKFEEARQYLEYAIHLNNYYDSVNESKQDAADNEQKEKKEEAEKRRRKSSKRKPKEEEKEKKKDRSYHRFAFIHVWLAMLLTNFEEEFREREYETERKLREEIKQKYLSQQRPKKVSRKNTNNKEEDDMILTNQETMEYDAVFTPTQPDTVDEHTAFDDAASRKSSLDRLGGDSPSPGPSSSRAPPAFNRKSSSVFLVRQLSHAQAYHRHHNSITRTLMMQRQYHESVEEQEHEVSVSGTATATATQTEADEVLPAESLSMATNNTSELPKLSALTQDTSQNVEKLIEQRLADDSLTQQIGQRFGAEFMKQMSAIPDKPEEHFQLALKLEPQNSQFYGIYGVFLMQQEKFEAAKAVLEKAIKYDGKNVSALNNLGWILSLTRFSQYQEAKNYLSKASKLCAHSAHIQFNLARLLAHAFGAEHIHNAKRYYLAALTNDASNPHIHYYYALFLRFVLKDNAEAKKHLLKSDALLDALSGDTMFEVHGYIEHAKILQHESKFKAAQFLLKRAAKIDITKRREIADLLKNIKAEEDALQQMQ